MITLADLEDAKRILDLKACEWQDKEARLANAEAEVKRLGDLYSNFRIEVAEIVYGEGYAGGRTYGEILQQCRRTRDRADAHEKEVLWCKSRLETTEAALSGVVREFPYMYEHAPWMQKVVAALTPKQQEVLPNE